MPRKNHGGARLGAGRPPKAPRYAQEVAAQEAKLVAVLLEMLDLILGAARAGDTSAAKYVVGYNRGLQWERTCAEVLKLRITRGGRSSSAEQPIAAGSGGDSLQFAAVLASNQNQDGKSGLSRSPTP